MCGGGGTLGRRTTVASFFHAIVETPPLVCFDIYSNNSLCRNFHLPRLPPSANALGSIFNYLSDNHTHMYDTDTFPH